MVKYSLVADNIITNNTIVLMDKHSVVDIDRFIYNGFNSEEELKKYFNLTSEYNFFIKYTYRQLIKTLKIIIKEDSNYDFGNILKYTSGANIDKTLPSFENYINNFISNCNEKQVEYLRMIGAIDSKVYYDLLEYFNIFTFRHNDQNEIISEIKTILSRYINFRKFYLGIYNYNHMNMRKNNVNELLENENKELVFTDDELLNDIYNNAGLDGVWSTYDIDDLWLVEGIEKLNIDGMQLIKKR